MLLQTATDFEAVFIQLDQPDTKEKIANISPSGKVPVLKHGDQLIWDSLAIGEYLAEVFPNALLWPKEAKSRALARSISAEMHAGFQSLRKHLPYNLEARFPYPDLLEETEREISRVIQIWQDCRLKHYSNGEFLFGSFTIADAMFAPVITRFITYNVPLPEIVQQYIASIMALPEMQMWCNDI